MSALGRMIGADEKQCADCAIRSAVAHIRWCRGSATSAGAAAGGGYTRVQREFVWPFGLRGPGGSVPGNAGQCNPCRAFSGLRKVMHQRLDTACIPVLEADFRQHGRCTAPQAPGDWAPPMPSEAELLAALAESEAEAEAGLVVSATRSCVNYARALRGWEGRAVATDRADAKPGSSPRRRSSSRLARPDRFVPCGSIMRKLGRPEATRNLGRGNRGRVAPDHQQPGRRFARSSSLTRTWPGATGSPTSRSRG